MPMLGNIIAATVADSLVGLIGITTLLIRSKLLKLLLEPLVAFSAGALVGGAFFHLLLESVSTLPAMNAMGFAVIGFVFFLLIEGFFHWHLCEKCNAHPFTYLMLIGDGMHNFIDGLVIAAAFWAGTGLGITTLVMIILHEAPQEIGLFGSLMYGGYSRGKSLLYSFIAQLTVIVGGVAGYFLSSQASQASLFLLPFAAGGFIYIAAADLVPEMHRMYRGNLRKTAKVLISFAVGIILMLAMKSFLGG